MVAGCLDHSSGSKAEGLAMDTHSVHSIRLLAADMVDNANSGHLGAVFGCAPLANALWTRIMKYSPQKPWVNRDRFVLSAGHASALQYSMLHLSGYDLSMDDLKQFRSAGSVTPGHPEFGITAGVEATTGPLGQGFANAVGMAIAEAHMAARFNRDGFPMFDYHTYVLSGDGCMMEGIASEAASLAGHLRLHKLIAFYDDNEVTIDGKTDIAFTEDVGARFAAYGWNVLRIEIGNSCDSAVYEKAVQDAKSQAEKPTIIMMKTIIGCGAGPGIEGESKAHGGKFSNLESLRQKWFSPAGLHETGDELDAQVANLVEFEMERLGIEGVLPKFHVPKVVSDKFREAGACGDRMAEQWEEMLKEYCLTFRQTEPEIVSDLERRMSGQYLTEAWPGKANDYLQQEQETIYPKLRSLLNVEQPDSTSKSQDSKIKYKAGRIYASEVLKQLVEHNPAVIGGSPDVASSCGGHFPSIQGHFLPPAYSTKYAGASYAGRYIHFGIREHACLAILNGISASAPLLPFSSMFTVFYQYGLPAMRIASISRLPILYIGTHESIEVGEDGPTHQPVEVLPQLRAMPNLLVIRPANVEETVGAFQVYSQQYAASRGSGWCADAESSRPVFLMTTRGELGLPYRSNTSISGQDGVAKGAYVLHDCCDELSAPSKPDIILIASGQDVALNMKTKEILLRWSKALNEKTHAPFFPALKAKSAEQLKVRIVSMPCWELFDEQDAAYQESVLLTSCKDVLRIYVEKASTERTGHDKYAHMSVVMSSYGMSGKASEVEKKLEFTPELVAAKVWNAWMERARVPSAGGILSGQNIGTWASHLGRFGKFLLSAVVWSVFRRTPFTQQKMLTS